MNNKSKPKPNTPVRIMLDRYGEPYLRKIWEDKKGAIGAAKVISDDMGVWCTPGRFEYLSKLYNWRRRIDADHPIALGVLRGNKNGEDYPRIIFPGDEDYE